MTTGLMNTSASPHIPSTSRNRTCPATSSNEIAVLDVETTGLFPGGADRIIEVGIVRMKLDGTILDEYVTLINPCRDVGRTDIHGIRAGDVAGAPKFAAVVGDISARLQGVIIAGHNVTFDARFLEFEMARAGYAVPTMKLLCSMREIGGRLVDCCHSYGIEIEQAHSALHDARATGRLLVKWLSELELDQDLRSLVFEYPGRGSDWPAVAPSGTSIRRELATVIRAANTDFLAQLVSRLPVAVGVGSPAAFGRYYSLLDQVLEDRRVSDIERVEIERLAREWGLTAREARDVHVAYIARLVTQALADGVVTPAEQRDLEEVATALGIDHGALEALLHPPEREAVRPIRSELSSLAGKTVCFTGELLSSIHGKRITRECAERLATEAGLIVLRGVTKKLDLLVLADPDTQSGKAQKARAYGTRLMAEPVFWAALGLDVE